MQEKNRFVRGLAAWVGFKSVGIEIERQPRFAGESKAHTFKVLDLAIKGIFAHSYKPLKIMSFFGSLISICSLISSIPLYFFWKKHGVPIPGFGSIMILLLLIVTCLSALLVIISQYIALIYEEVKNRPNYIVSEIIN